MPRFGLNGKVALITGGARGIGFATAQALAHRGASIVILDLDEVAAQGAAGQCGAQQNLGIAADVSDRAAMQRAVARIVEEFGGLDVVVANAGIASRGATFRAMATESFERVLEVNLMGVWRTVDAALAQIIQRRGHIVLTSSVYAFVNGVGVTPYAMSKAAVEQFGRALRVELAPHGAGASVAYFGFIDTEMVHQGIDNDPLALEMMKLTPGVLRKRLAPKVAGEAIAHGIERRAPRIIRPRRWAAWSYARGLVNPLLDAQMERHAATQAIVERLDARAGEDQPTTS